MFAYYGTKISPNIDRTPEGYLICRNVPIARTGGQEYLAREIGLDGDPERVITVNREAEEVFSPAALASFEGKPVTDGHPPENLGPENFGAYIRGHVSRVHTSGEFVVADLYINDKNLASDIQNGVKREVSCGYTCQYEPAGEGYRQTQIRGNHVAVVPRGRAGHDVAIQDSAGEAGKRSEKTMFKWKEKIADAFRQAAQEAEPAEMAELAKAASLALDAEPAAKAQEAEPAKDAPAGDVMVERAPKGDDLGSKLDKILERLEALEHKNDREEKKLSDELDLDDLLKRLTPEKEEEAITISEEDEKCATLSQDAAVQMIKRVRPAVAAIRDKAQRARVVDALLSCIGGDGSMGRIVQAAHDSAQAKNDKDRQTKYEKICEDSERAYAARNPHKQKEE